MTGSPGTRRCAAAALGLMLLALAVPASAPAEVVPLSAIGGEGTDAGELRLPFDVAADPGGRLYVADTGNHRISVFEADGTFAFAFGWGVNPQQAGGGFEVCTADTTCGDGAIGGGAGQIAHATRLTLDEAGHLYVTDEERVSVFDVGEENRPRFVRAFGWDVDPGGGEGVPEVCTATCQTGTVGSGAGQFAFPIGIAVTPAGDEIAVSDLANHRIDVFTGAGAFVRSFGWNVDPAGGPGGFEVCTAATGCGPGAAGGGAGQLDQPVGIARGPGGLLYVAEALNERISVFDTEAPAFVRALGWDVDTDGGAGGFEICTTTCRPGVRGDGAGRLAGPTGLAVDAAGGIAVTELFNQRVSRFGAAGFLDAFGGGVRSGAPGFEVCIAACRRGVAGFGPGALTNAQDVTLDCRGAMWVADASNHRVQRFGEPGTPLPVCAIPDDGGGDDDGDGDDRGDDGGGAGPPGGGGSGGGGLPRVDRTAPVLSRVSLRRTTFAVGGALTARAAQRRPRGSAFRFVLSERATVRIAIARRGSGRRAGSITRRDRPARANTIPFSGRIGRRALSPGRYRATLSATDAAGNRSAPRRLAFRIAWR